MMIMVALLGMVPSGKSYRNWFRCATRTRDRRSRGALSHPIIDPTGIAVSLLSIGQSQTQESGTKYLTGIDL